MAIGVKAAPALPKFKMPKMPTAPKTKPMVVKGPPVAKIKPLPAPKSITVQSLGLTARHGLGPKLALAKAAAGANAVTSKRNPNYPTP